MSSDTQTLVTVRLATEADAQTIATYNQSMAMETEHKYLDDEIVLRGVKRVFATPEYGFYLVAEIDGNVAGCLMITYEWSDWRDGLFWWIQSVYVAENARRLGVFKSLYKHVEELAKESGNACGIRLYVEQHNARAQETYQSLGMIKTDYHLYETDFGSS